MKQNENHCRKYISQCSPWYCNKYFDVWLNAIEYVLTNEATFFIGTLSSVS